MTAKCRPGRRQSTAIVNLGGWETGTAALQVARQKRRNARSFVRSFVHIKTGMPPYGAHPCFTFSCPGFAGAYIALSTIPNTGITVSIEQKAATPSFGMIFIGTSIFKWPTRHPQLT
jgi:hypothetical protein